MENTINRKAVETSQKFSTAFLLIISLNALVLSSVLCDKFFYLFIQAFGFHQLLQRQVHAPAPVVTWVGWHINALFLCVGVAPFAVHGHPVLQGEDGEYGVALQMLAHHLFAKLGSGSCGGSAIVSEHRVVVTLCLLKVLFPPAAQCGHVVGGYGAD